MEGRSTVETTPRFDKEIANLDKYTQKMLKTWITDNLIDTDNTIGHGKSLTANRSGQWRYRIGDYRIICQIEEEKLVMLALSVGHRKEL